MEKTLRDKTFNKKMKKIVKIYQENDKKIDKYEKKNKLTPKQETKLEELIRKQQSMEPAIEIMNAAKENRGQYKSVRNLIQQIKAPVNVKEDLKGEWRYQVIERGKLLNQLIENAEKYNAKQLSQDQFDNSVKACKESSDNLALRLEQLNNYIEPININQHQYKKSSKAPKMKQVLNYHKEIEKLKEKEQIIQEKVGIGEKVYSDATEKKAKAKAAVKTAELDTKSARLEKEIAKKKELKAIAKFKKAVEKGKEDRSQIKMHAQDRAIEKIDAIEAVQDKKAKLMETEQERAEAKIEKAKAKADLLKAKQKLAKTEKGIKRTNHNLGRI